MRERSTEATVCREHQASACCGAGITPNCCIRRIMLNRPRNSTIFADDPVEDATWHLNTLASGRDALQFTSVRAPTGPPLGHLVPFRDQLLNAGMPVGE